VTQKAFVDGLKQVKVSISLNPRNDETTQLCKYVIPDHHYLESWGDAEPRSGFFSLMQPTINPLFKTRQWQESLLKWNGAVADFHTYFKNYWMGKLGSEVSYEKALQDRYYHNTSITPVSAVSANITDTDHRLR
jgi:molybdopterin-containing oxidoreductase family iron-sulfur binding subunit